MSSHSAIKFIDLHAQREKIQAPIDAALQDVMSHGQFILGDEVKQLEEELKTYTGAKHAISCASGTDALKLVLLTKDIKVNDVIFVPSFTFAATAEVVAELGAIPYFIDVCPDTYNLNPSSLLAGIEEAKNKGLVLKGIIAVDLFGLPADYPALQSIAHKNNLWILADAAQSFGGAIGKKRVGNLCDMTATSFFPSKPLGGYGDGGCIFTNDNDLNDLTRSLRAHGTGADKYDHIRVGLNSRLDTLQAAILLKKLDIFDDELARRQHIANFYAESLSPKFHVPQTPDDFTHGFGLYTIRCESQQQRDALKAHLNDNNIPSVIYYHRPLHKQVAYEQFPQVNQKLPVTELLCEQVLSLPMHPYLEDNQLEFICDTLRQS